LRATWLKGLAMKTATLFALVVSLAAAQAPTTGTIAGSVQDAAGGALPGVAVTATSSAGVAASATTDGNGTYRLAVPAGSYEVTAELTGFAGAFRNNVTVAGGSRTDVSFTLRVHVTPFPPGTAPFRRPNVDITADSQSRQGSIVQYRGNVRMRTSDSEIAADEIDLDTNRRTAVARGDVRIRLLAPEYRVIPVPAR
jgi:hypothetical protein